MLTNLVVRNFKLFRDVSVELSQRVVFVGPNNSGKTSALQALALWSTGVRRWVEKRGGGSVPKARPGVTINRRDLLALPVPTASHLWRDLTAPPLSALKARGVPVLCWTIRSAEQETQARELADNITFEGYLAPRPA